MKFVCHSLAIDEITKELRAAMPLSGAARVRMADRLGAMRDFVAKAEINARRAKERRALASGVAAVMQEDIGRRG